MNSVNQMAPHEDYGFFGPDSVAWKVFCYPTTLTVGFQRTLRPHAAVHGDHRLP
ncbi:MAG: hypothetical protein JWN03_4426 [Nocardia sp.]|uniref:hypothetical protein n=1 Tax=Nocardia sp. TaxID=1821 RepID=UPI0034568587|nr:hypothetical protein [Nocardia sp.]